MIEKLNGKLVANHYAEQSAERKSQIGSGMRGDKIRTYQIQHDIASDHRTGKKMSVAKFMKGDISDLWD